MADKPNILLVFSNPLNDLNCIKEEQENVLDTLQYTKRRQKNFDFDPQPDKSLMEVVEETTGIVDYTASIFHFSGHANEHTLLFSGSQGKLTTICSLLRRMGTKLVFLNGCCTRGFLEEMFRDTGVKAAIVTYCKVGDERAAKISNSFYRFFVRNNNTLHQAFLNVQVDYQEGLFDPDGLDVSARDLSIGGSGLPDEDGDDFQWGLFYKGTGFRNVTIGTILQDESENSGELVEQIAAEERAINELKKLITDLSSMPANSSIQKVIEEKNLELQIAQTKMHDLQSKLEHLQEQKKIADDVLGDRLKSEDFTRAIKNINYVDQLEAYRTATGSPFSCFAAIGDQGALMDLLLLRIEEENRFRSENYLPVHVDYKAAVRGNIWSVLGVEIGCAGETASNVAKKLIEEVYLLKNTISPHRHVFLKIQINDIPIEILRDIVADFWKHIQLAYTAKFSGTAPRGIWTKIIMILIDDNGCAARHGKLEELAALVNTHLDPKLNPFPLIKRLDPDDIRTWIKSHDLARVGIKTSMADDIFKDGENGKLRKVLEAVKNKCTMKDLQLFYTLNI